jgi:hypothetical protein
MITVTKCIGAVSEVLSDASTTTGTIVMQGERMWAAKGIAVPTYTGSPALPNQLQRDVS